MAGNILTPKAVWSDFNITTTPKAEIIDEITKDGVTYTRMYIEGNEVGDSKTLIYGLLAKKERLTSAPAILLVQDFQTETDILLVNDLVSKGFTVLSIDLAGEREDKDLYTVYPEKCSYANYEKVKEDLYSVKSNVRQTCWYEWGSATRFALAYLKGLSFVGKVGGLAVGESATVLWNVAGMDENLQSACFILNAGWVAYRGTEKFGGKVDQQFSDNMYKYIAGVEPQSYASHVKCPTLVLSSTNSQLYDCDRAYDTVSRIDNVYKVLHYSPDCIERVNSDAYKNLLIFFNETLSKKTNAKIALSQEMDIKCDLIDGVIRVEVLPALNNLKEVSIYVSEEIVIPCERSWKKVTNGVKREDGAFVFDYLPYSQSGVVTVYGQATYKNGFNICSNILAKKFAPQEVLSSHKSTIIFSSREENMETAFLPARQEKITENNGSLLDDVCVEVKKGPMQLEGIYCNGGLLTFQVGAKKDAPKEDAMLMLDVYGKENGVFTVKLIADYFGNKVEYLCSQKIAGGEVWYNLKFERNYFKTAEGRVLKEYQKINAIEFNFDNGEFLINNALWV